MTSPSTWSHSYRPSQSLIAYSMRIRRGEAREIWLRALTSDRHTEGAVVYQARLISLAQEVERGRRRSAGVRRISPHRLTAFL